MKFNDISFPSIPIISIGLTDFTEDIFSEILFPSISSPFVTLGKFSNKFFKAFVKNSGVNLFNSPHSAFVILESEKISRTCLLILSCFSCSWFSCFCPTFSFIRFLQLSLKALLFDVFILLSSSSVPTTTSPSS